MADHRRSARPAFRFPLTCLAAGVLMGIGLLAGPVAGRVALSAAAQPTAQPTTLAQAVARVDAMAESDSADIGVAVLDRTTGQLTLGTEGSTPFYSASVVKLFTVVDILHRTETGGTQLTDTQRDQVRQALRVSDNAAMTALWNAFGGTRTVTELTSLAGLRDTTPPGNPAEWGETAISARDVVAVYRYALTSLNEADQDLLLSSLATPGVTGSGGFDQSFGVLRTPALPGAAGKQGWMIDQGSLYLHSSGLLGDGHRYAVAVLSKQPGSVGYPAARQRLNSAMGTLAGVLDLNSTGGSGGAPSSSL